VQDWEKEITEADLMEYDWNMSQSKKNIVDLVKRIDEIKDDKNITDEEEIVSLEPVKKYSKELTRMFDKGETSENLSSYKNSVLEMLKLKPQPKPQTNEQKL
jgi:hypothetical protein